MPIYALATIPLIDRINTDSVRQAWYADDSAATFNIVDLRE